MLNRRVDKLTRLLNELNPQSHLQVCRQLRLKLAETYSKMVISMMPSPGQILTPSQWADITSLNLREISCLKLFLKSFEDSSGNAPFRYPEEAEPDAVVALFSMGRLWNKIRVASLPQIIQNTNNVIQNVNNCIQNSNNAIDCFKKVLEYVERNPECRDNLNAEMVGRTIISSTDEIVEFCEEILQACEENVQLDEKFLQLLRLKLELLAASHKRETNNEAF